ncbi:MAG: tRNA lysidine(34) synthetase TilS [Akkermansiaceae bacterium]
MGFLDPDWLEGAAGKRWLVGVSGGRDSVALLHACVRDVRLMESRSLVICHVNHGLRGVESDGDEALVRELAEGYGLEVFVRKVDVGEIAEEEKKSLELAAREVRHAAFAEACREYGCDGVLLGHHADDQVETVIYNLVRGSAGLRGMQKESYLSAHKLTLVRPLLGVRQCEIDTYVAEHGLVFREDATNAEAFAVRNRLRNEVMPLLVDIMGRDVGPAVLKSLKCAEMNEEFIEEAFDYGSMLDPQGRLHLPSLREVPRVIQLRILHRYLVECGVGNISSELVEAGVGLLDLGNAAKINLPGGKFLRRKAQRVFVE